MFYSLLIRLDLAKFFSKNCNILTLDEPTTNLDIENMNNFTAQLNSLIKKNLKINISFQLIIISHSQDFVNSLTQNDIIKYFYRLDKKKENNRSFTKIYKHHFSSLYKIIY